MTAVYLLNRSSSKSIGGKTPYELWTGSAPGVHNLHTFGCIAQVKVTTPNLKKLDDRSRCMIFVGYEPAPRRIASTTSQPGASTSVVMSSSTRLHSGHGPLSTTASPRTSSSRRPHQWSLP